MKTTIVLTGGSGLLAVNWAAKMRDQYHVVLLLHERNVQLHNVTSIKANLDLVEDVIEVLRSVKAGIIIHTAGLTNVESCEQNTTLAHQINVTISQNIAKAATLLGIKMVHISTDHLYEGTAAFSTEETPVNPLNVYGKTKALAESVVAEINPDALIIRTNFYGWGTGYRKSFSDMIIGSLRQNKEITLFGDVYFTPVYVGILISFVHKLLGKTSKGVFNVVGDERISKYEFGVLIANIFNLDKNLITLGALSSNMQLVQRPLDMSLSNKKMSDFLGIKTGSLKEQIELLKKEENHSETIEIKNL